MFFANELVRIARHSRRRYRRTGTRTKHNPAISTITGLAPGRRKQHSSLPVIHIFFTRYFPGCLFCSLTFRSMSAPGTIRTTTSSKLFTKRRRSRRTPRSNWLKLLQFSFPRLCQVSRVNIRAVVFLLSEKSKNLPPSKSRPPFTSPPYILLVSVQSYPSKSNPTILTLYCC